MSYMILVSATLFISFCAIGAGIYNRKNEGCRGTAAIYNLLQLFAVFSLWLIKFLSSPQIDPAVLIYSALFALGYTTAMVVAVSAYREGSLVLTSLIMQLSFCCISLS